MPIKINSLILHWDFIVAYACGVVILVLFCLERFNEPTNTGGSFLEALVPKAISNGFQYTQTFVIYLAIMLLIYTGFSVIGPTILPILGLDPKVAGFTDVEALAVSAQDALKEGTQFPVPAWVPLMILLVLTGGATHFRALNQIEFRARRLAHRLIGIPQEIESLASNLRDRRIVLNELSSTECANLIAFYEEISGSSDPSIEVVKTAITNDDALRRWLRLSFLRYQMETKDLPAGFKEVTEGDYSGVWEAVRRSIDELRADKSRLSVLSANVVDLGPADRDTRTQILAKITESLRDLHALIAIGVYPVRKDAGRVKQITDTLKLAEGDVEDNTLLNKVVLAMIALFFGVLMVVYWSERDPITALRWAAGSCFLHGAAALATWRYYVARNRKMEWRPLSFSHGEIHALQYLNVAWRGFLFGTLALAAWHAIDQLLSNGVFPEISGRLIWIPAFGALGVATAFWTAYDFDILQRSSSILRRAAQVVMQGLTTGACAYFITIAIQSAFGLDLKVGQPIAIQVTITAAVSGGILGYIAVFLTHQNEVSRVDAHFIEPTMSNA